MSGTAGVEQLAEFLGGLDHDVIVETAGGKWNITEALGDLLIQFVRQLARVGVLETALRTVVDSAKHSEIGDLAQRALDDDSMMVTGPGGENG